MKYPPIEDVYAIFLQHPIVCTDSRSVQPGNIFFGLKGGNFNGNLFARDTLKAGAVKAVIDEEAYYTEGCILVKDTLKTLQELANYHRRKLNIPVIAITGTNGKTTTKELTAAVLSQKYKTLFTQGNLNNHIGVPLTLLKLTREHEMAVIEMGANHQGEIAELCKIAEPGYGLITNIGKAHLEGFGGPEGVIKAKSELYQFIKSHGGTLFVNADDTLLMQLSEGANRVKYGTNRGDNCEGLQDKTSFLAKGIFLDDGIEVEIKSQLAGQYNFYNILAATCIGFQFGLTIGQIKRAIEEYVPSNNRSQLVNRGSNTIWVDTYNANPTSMKLAVENFADMPVVGKVLILGDMFELGTDSATEHQTLATLIDSKKWDGIHLVGKEFSLVKSSGRKYETLEGFIDWIKKNPLTEKTILLKGSRGMQMERVLEHL